MIKYRRPKVGHKYSYGGSLKRENANEFAVYLNGCYTSKEMQEAWSRSGEAHRSLFMLTKKVDKVKELLENE